MGDKSKKKSTQSKKPRKPYEPIIPIEGDLVMLRSGGPQMTVAELEGARPDKVNEDDIFVIYFVGDQLQSKFFAPVLLKIVPQEE